MSDHRGRWLPFNPDGKIHECKKVVNDNVAVSANSNENGNGNDISVEVLLKRLEQLGVSIDLTKLRLVK